MTGHDRQSESIAKLAEALSKAQGKIRGAAKDAENPFFGSKYADLSAVWDACREPLSENGLAVIQTTELAGTDVCLVTTLVHSSGEWIRGVLPVRPVKNDPQAQGSAITYARRYALQAIVGIAPEDDDGEAGMGRGTRTKTASKKESSPGTTPKPLTQGSAGEARPPCPKCNKPMPDSKWPNKATGKPDYYCFECKHALPRAAG